MRILVTGGLGFIGQHLVKKLMSEFSDSTIDIVDNLSNNSIKPEHIKSDNVNVVISSVDVFVPKDKYDYIYHLASPVGPAGVLNYAGKMGPMVVNDAYKLAKIALDMGAKLLDVSTSEVYGRDPGGIPQKEDIDKIVPSNITIRLEYGVAKLLSEICLFNLMKVTPLKVNFIRPFNIIGPGQRGEVGFVLPRFVQSALSGEPLTVFGNGTQVRTFTHVEDIVDAMIMIMKSKISGEVFNVGNPQNLISIHDLAKKVVEFSHSSSDIKFVDPTTIYGPYYAEAWNKIPDIHKIQNMLDWNPKWELDDIIKQVIEVNM